MSDRKHIEMIIDYVVDGDDFQYNDNHGVLTRCKDCVNFEPIMEDIAYCKNGKYTKFTSPDDFCSKAERCKE